LNNFFLDFDVNPSVGLAVNRLGFVIGAAAYNEERRIGYSAERPPEK
jgi:hypothetical protein